jgi:uncharacterized protein (DUF885 family)
MPRDSQSDASITQALRVINDAWEELGRSPFVQQQLGVDLTRLPDLSFEEAERRSRVGRTLLERLEATDLDSLPHDLALTLRLVRFRAKAWEREAEWYWTVIDPLGIGFFGMFLPTAYCGGWLLNLIHGRLAAFRFEESGDCDRYLELIVDYSELINQFAARTAGQAERAIRISKVQIRQARALLAQFKASAHTALTVAPRRAEGMRVGGFIPELENRIATSVTPAFDRALGNLSEEYFAAAPEDVGLGQYRGGDAIYGELVKMHTTLDLTPKEVHAQGLARIAEIERAMQTIQTALGFEGDRAAFLAHLESDARWRATTAEGVCALFHRYLDRLKPHLSEYFSVLPKAAYGVAPLPEALQASMTFGYYDPPRPECQQGRYLFNSEQLTKRPLFNLASLIHHELMPGHHLHFATQQENSLLHPFRRYSFINAYNEGWAEYAATFAGEIGMYDELEERYGRLVWDALFTCRLVVDTGMNALNWSLERAREYLREHSGMSEAEIQTESVRYSCDIPGQSLAYKLGDAQILAYRERMRHALGAQFRLKDFHAAVLGPGALPLPDLEWHIDYETERIKRGCSCETDCSTTPSSTHQ